MTVTVWPCSCGCGLDEADPRHGGSGNAYSNLRCRCTECRRVNTARVLRRKAERLREIPPDRVHGTRGGYLNWGCRCRPCTDAHSAACAAYYRATHTPARQGQR